MRFEVEVGQLVAARYRLARLLGRGAMGEVWLAHHATLGEEVAIKFLRPEDAGGEDAASTLSRFLFEAKVAARLSRKSRHIVQVTDQGEEGGVPYLVMERLEGESLEERFARGPLPMDALQAIVTQCARGLSVAHGEGVFHRDLKPANVFLGTDDEGRLLVKLLDFGIARAIRPEKARSPTSTARGVVLGTPSYMSPEQARGLKHLDHRCDVWALAVVAYEGLTGRIPFQGETVEDVYVAVCTHALIPIEERKPGVDPAIRAFFAHALAEKVGERFQSAEELATAFAALEACDLHADASPPTSRDAAGENSATQARLAVSMRATPHRPTRAAWAALGAVAALVALAVAAKIAVSSRVDEGGSRQPAGPVSVPIATVDSEASPASSASPSLPSPSALPDPIPIVAASSLPVASPSRAPPPRPTGPPAGRAGAPTPSASAPPRPSTSPPDIKKPPNQSEVF